jgi:hypothetical protein
MIRDLLTKMRLLESGGQVQTPQKSRWEEDTRGLDKPEDDSGTLDIKEAGGPPSLIQVYPDTKEGVLQYMQHGYNKSFLKKLDLATCTIHPDPSVEGVWAVDSPKTGQRCIIYLAGYSEGAGTRKHNDNEEGTVPMSLAKRWIESGTTTLQDLSNWVDFDSKTLEKLKQFSPDYDMFGESYYYDDDAAMSLDPQPEWNDQDDEYECPVCNPDGRSKNQNCKRCGGTGRAIDESVRRTYDLKVVEYVKIDPRSSAGTADGYIYDANDEEIPVNLEFDYELASRDNGDADSWTPGPGSDTHVELTRVTDENGIEIPLEDVLFDQDMLNQAIEEASAERSFGESMVGVKKTQFESKNTMYNIKKGLMIVEGRMFEGGSETLTHVLNRFKAEVKAFERGEELDSELYEALFDYYSDAGEMPYGTMKARTGDPYEWVTQRLDQELGSSMPKSDFDRRTAAPMEAAPEEETWHDADGNQDDGGAYDAGGHYDAERDADRSDYLRDDSAIPVLDRGEEVVTEEGTEGLVSDILTSVGLDEGYDFFFDGGLVVIGRSTARVVMNALKNDVRFEETPSIESIDGEEVRISFGQRQEKLEPTTDMVNDLARVPELEENIGYECPTCHAKTVTDFDGTCKICGTLKEESMTGMNESVSVNISAQDEDALDLIKKLSGISSEEKAPGSVEVVDTATCSTSPVANNGGDLAKLMGMFGESKEPVRSADREDDDDDTNWEEEDDLSESKKDRKDRGDQVYDNTPDEKVADVSASIPSGNDLHKSKKMGHQGGLTGGDNPLEESLWAEYQALKEGKADDLADKKAAEEDDDWWGAKAKSNKKPPVKTVKGTAYGGTKQKDEVEKDEDDAPKKRGRPAKKK